MPLASKKAGDCRGSEADGSKSEKYCLLCYVEGRFVDPDCTVDEMMALVEIALKKDNAGLFMRKIAKRQIPTCERWQS